MNEYLLSLLKDRFDLEALKIKLLKDKDLKLLLADLRDIRFKITPILDKYIETYTDSNEQFDLSQYFLEELIKDIGLDDI